MGTFIFNFFICVHKIPHLSGDFEVFELSGNVFQQPVK